jgi:hypothetical protein
MAGLPGWALAAALVLLAGPAVLAVLAIRRTRRPRGGGAPGPRRSGTSGSLGNAFLEVHALLEPDRRHVLEIRRVEDGEDDESGDPPEPGRRPPGR